MTGVELKPHIDRHGNFYIRYDVAPNEEPDGGNYWLNADVYEVVGWATDGAPVFYGSVSAPTHTDPTHEAVKPFLNVNIKWDGCTHLSVRQFHFDTFEEFDALRECLRYIYEDLCEANNVVD